MPKVTNRAEILDAIKRELGSLPATISRGDLIRVCENQNVTWPAWLSNNSEYREGRGMYNLSKVDVNMVTVARTPRQAPEPKVPEATETSVVNMESSVTNVVPLKRTEPGDASVVSFVPKKVKGYVPFGHFSDLRSILKSGRFYPAFITGLSGNGKTMMVEQICAVEKREYIRVNITIETDEDDLIGGFRLVDGHTVWQNGPVVVAMERGAVLLLDEVDLGSNKLMCLQPVLEGKSIYLKKINKRIDPAPGFTVVATGNTKGKGSDDGRFIGTNVMNEAFLERFPITFEQDYPPAKTEAKILNNVLVAAGAEDADFTEKLINWADVIRKSFAEGAVSEIISTRRLVHICEAYGIFKQNRLKAIELCLNRFDNETKNGFLDLYKKLDVVVDATNKPEAANTPTPDDEIQF